MIKKHFTIYYTNNLNHFFKIVKNSMFFLGHVRDRQDFFN